MKKLPNFYVGFVNMIGGHIQTTMPSFFLFNHFLVCSIISWTAHNDQNGWFSLNFMKHVLSLHLNLGD